MHSSSHRRAHGHIEKHSTLGPFVRDAILGAADGLTVPFAVAAGLAFAGSGGSTLIITAVLAEIAAGSISMGLGGYLSADTDAKHYEAERAREVDEVIKKTDVEKEETRAIFKSYGLSAEESEKIIETLSKRQDDWVDFMMRFELGLEKPDRRASLRSAVTIGAAYAVSGAIPLLPYLFINDTMSALTISAVFTALALAVFGYFRGKLVVGKPWSSVLQTLLVGACAAGAAFIIARLIG
jgi:VIT1/CCC1 family predicted Fe2+/Mn2+ transporter